MRQKKWLRRTAAALAVCLGAPCVLPAAPCGPAPRRAEAFNLGHLFSGLFKGISDPAVLLTTYAQMRQDFAKAAVLQREAWDQYIALAESREYHATFDRNVVFASLVNDGMPPEQFYSAGRDPEEIKAKLDERLKVKDFLTPEIKAQVQAIADKRHAAHVYSGRASSAAGLIVASTLLNLFDGKEGGGEKAARVAFCIAAAADVSRTINEAHTYSTQTKAFLDPFEKKAGARQRTKDELEKMDWGFREDGSTPQTDTQAAPASTEERTYFRHTQGPAYEDEEAADA